MLRWGLEVIKPTGQITHSSIRSALFKDERVSNGGLLTKESSSNHKYDKKLTQPLSQNLVFRGRPGISRLWFSFPDSRLSLIKQGNRGRA
jgi:hypothetical protein